MCNLSWWSNSALAMATLTDMIDILTDWDSRWGGDGWGVGGFVKGKPVLKKAVKMSVDEVIKIVRETKWDGGCIIHCRDASTGYINDESCHPFMAVHGTGKNKTKYIVAHNGTFDEWKWFVPILLKDKKVKLGEIGNFMDTKAIAWCIEQRGPEALYHLENKFDFGKVIILGEKNMYCNGAFYNYFNDEIEYGSIEEEIPHVLTSHHDYLLPTIYQGKRTEKESFFLFDPTLKGKMAYPTFFIGDWDKTFFSYGYYQGKYQGQPLTQQTALRQSMQKTPFKPRDIEIIPLIKFMG